MNLCLWIVSFVCLAGVCSSLQISEHDWTKITSPLDSPKYQEILNKFYPTTPKNFTRVPKIVGGEMAAEGQFPFQVAMFLTGATENFFCGGSIIHENWVLTASHCLDSILNAEVYVGVHNIADGPAWWGKYVPLKDLIMHSGYDADVLNNDIALVRLTKAIPLTAKVSIISLPTRAMRTKTFVNYNGTVSGFGRASDLATGISRVMRFVSQVIVSNTVCANEYGKAVVTERTICISGNGGKSSCQVNIRRNILEILFNYEFIFFN